MALIRVNSHTVKGVRPSPFGNPFRFAFNVIRGRIDQGIDFTVDGPIAAVSTGKVLFINPNWFNGLPFVSYSTPFGNIYVAEHIRLRVGVGDRVTRDTILGIGYGG